MLPRFPESLILEAWALACLAQIGLVMLLALGKAGDVWQCLSPLVPWRIMVGLRASWLSSGVSGFVAHAVAFGKILAPGLTLSQWTSSGRFVTEESSSVIQSARSWVLLRPPSHCSLISALCCCFLIVFRPVPVSDNCIFSVKLFAQNKKETDFCFILPGPLWKGGGVDCKELFAWRVTWRWEIFSSQDSFILLWRFCLETFYESKDSWTFGHFFWSEIVAFD